MPITETDFVFRYPDVQDDTASNGGRMLPTPIVDGASNNVWQDVSQAERTAGSDKYRKVFCHVANDDDLTLQDVKVFVEKFTAGEDSVTIFLGDFDDVQGGLTGSEREYGCGQLNATVGPGVTTLDIATEGASLALFQNGDMIRVSDKDGVAGAGNEEYVTINAAVTYAGDVATVSFTPALANGYSNAATRVSSVISAPNVAASNPSWVESSASGTYDEVGSPLVLDHVSTVSEVWTLTMNSATTFTVVGDTLGSVGSGDTSTDFVPNNPNFSKPYFTLAFAGWGGTWATNDTITFRTDPAAIAIWEHRVVPAGAASLAGNEVRVAVDGASP